MENVIKIEDTPGKKLSGAAARTGNLIKKK